MPEGAANELSGSGVVLIVDDEPVVRQTAKATLQQYGYTVALAENGRVAVDIFRGVRDQVAVVILDLTMPVMGGEAALPELRKIDPKVRVIMSSGYSESAATGKFEGEGLAGFLQKPYTAKNTGRPR